MFEEIMLATEMERRTLREKRIIFLTSEIDGGASHQFIEDVYMLRGDKSKTPIKIIIASEGGEVFSGMAIIRAIRVLQKGGIKFTGEVHGHAMSMAFNILQCCDIRVMGKLDILMAHGITFGVSGDMKNMEAEKKLLEFWHSELSELIAKRCNANEEYRNPGYWFELLKDNTPQYYNSTECLEMGLIDKVE